MTGPRDDSFLGIWELVPELSLYETGRPPASGRYTISETEPGVLALHVRWQLDPDGPVHETGFGGRADGSPIALPAPAGGPANGPDQLTLTRIDAHTLDSAALRQGDVLASARRVASRDGSLLAVVQEQLDASGRRIRNFQLYRRIAQPPPADG